ncbi:RNA polymerase sigma factor [Agaribacter flavus]|uniref:RNA polymerase sigma factor n=1 Tax=Agaribacter flavus TaxID=1902781 RepID=A0ABV7FQR7_9ALTE
MLSIILKQIDGLFAAGTTSNDNCHRNKTATINRHAAVVEALYKKHSNEIYHYILTLSDPTSAEDISHQLWLKLIEQPDKYKHLSNFRAYI